MNKNVRTVLHHMKRLVIKGTHAVIGIFPKDDNLVLFSAWFGKKYQDSSRYVYEYCLAHNEFNVYWYAADKVLYSKLKAEGKPVVYAKSLEGIWKQIRAKMLVSSIQLADFNHFFLKKCIYLDLGHGMPIKQSGYEQPDVTQRYINYEKLLRKDISFYMCESSTTSMHIISRAFRISPKNIVFCNKPRTDVLYDPSLRAGKNKIVDQLKGDKKAIVYMPTHRSGGAVRINTCELMDMDTIQKLAEEYNFVFLIKKHFYHRNEKDDVDKYPNIFDITDQDIDPQTLVYQADALISDYSASYIDYLLLDRPIIFFTYDIDEFLKTERNLYFKFSENHAGAKAVTKEELNDAIRNVCKDWKDPEHAEGRRAARLRYFDDDCPVGNARESIVKIMHELINGTYHSKWENSK